MSQSDLYIDKICAQYGMDLISLPRNLYKKIENLLVEENFDKFEQDLKNFLKSNKEIEILWRGKVLSYLKWIVDNKEKDKYQEFRRGKMNFEPKSYEIEITKALGILIEDGPFAYIIWLKSQNKEPHKVILIQTARILQKVGLINIIDDVTNFNELQTAFLDKIAQNLNCTLLVKSILEKMLIYARYQAKAMQ